MKRSIKIRTNKGEENSKEDNDKGEQSTAVKVKLNK